MGKPRKAHRRRQVTLGYGASVRTGSTTLEYLATFTGLVGVGLPGGYLPRPYGAFNRGETEISLLGSRSGVPLTLPLGEAAR